MINVGFDFFNQSVGAVSDKKERPANDTKIYYFETVCDFLKQEGDLHTLKELYLKICGLAESTDVYAAEWLKSRLKEKYGEHMFFTEIKVRANPRARSSILPIPCALRVELGNQFGSCWLLYQLNKLGLLYL